MSDTPLQFCLEEIAMQLGFQDAAEFHRMVATADLSTPAKFAAFRKWQEEDGTKDGLQKLIEQKSGVGPTAEADADKIMERIEAVASGVGLREPLCEIPDNELPGMWERADFMGGQDEVRGPGDAGVLASAPVGELAMLRRDIERLPKSPGKDDALRHMTELERAIARGVAAPARPADATPEEWAAAVRLTFATARSLSALQGIPSHWLDAMRDSALGAPAGDGETHSQQSTTSSVMSRPRDRG